jgi:single-strand DNA-binding protein
VEVEADALGHDLTWGTTAFTRVIMTAAAAGHHDEDAGHDAPAPGASPAVGWATPGVLTDAAAGVAADDDVERASAAADYREENAVTPF